MMMMENAMKEMVLYLNIVARHIKHFNVSRLRLLGSLRLVIVIGSIA